MIRLDVFESGEQITRFVLSGHAGYSKAGTDIVCAAVSALAYNAINSCEKFLGVQLDVTDDGDELRCHMTGARDREDVQLLVRSMVFGIEQTARLYPKHVKIRRHDEKMVEE